jgi:hypothetical protein
MVLSVNNLTGFGGGDLPPIVSTFQSAQQVTVVTLVGTWTSAPIGTASSDRRVIVGWSVDGSLAGTTVTATLGGNAMTELFYIEDGDSYVGFFGIDYPTGTTATLVLTGTAGFRDQLCCAIWSVTGLRGLTPTDTDGAAIGGGGPYTASMTATSARNITFSACGDRVVGVTGFTWTGATEHADINISSSNHSFASVANQPAGTINVTCDPATVNATMATISFSQ